MTKQQARLLILVLSAKRIDFKLRREGSAYVVSFDLNLASGVADAIGA